MQVQFLPPSGIDTYLFYQFSCISLVIDICLPTRPKSRGNRSPRTPHLWQTWWENRHRGDRRWTAEKNLGEETVAWYQTMWVRPNIEHSERKIRFERKDSRKSNAHNHLSVYLRVLEIWSLQVPAFENFSILSITGCESIEMSVAFFFESDSALSLR